ncbi:uncharacterized protein LOC116300604 [Actinia tenebrosa]|uniref:Glycine cleavage system H protein n=1 Tax=Actinia tenebrosa TaxID=6105 RepID=A0A6P8IEL1_ACTTE|nr:uncharacterized protein LOC116300604 [Actinia tenebrosa]
MACIVLRRAAGILPVTLRSAAGNIHKLQAQASRSYSLTRHLLGERKFTKEHEWVSVDNGIATVGVSNYAQEKLGDIVFVQMPEVGDHFDKDTEFGALESVKAASDLFLPLTGKISEINTSLEETPSLVNESPYDNGWIVKMEVENPSELDDLMDEKAYDDFLENIEN